MRSAAEMSDSELLAALALPSLVEQESGGRVGVLGPQTKYGRAQGMTQMLPATAQATARKIGMEWRPELMTAQTPEAADYQQALGEAYLREGIEATGNLEDGFRYYHGGPNREQWGPKTNAYAEQVMGRVGQGGEPAPSAVSQMSDEELLAALGEGAEPAPAPAAAPPRAAAPKPRTALPAAPQRLPQKQARPTLEQDIGSGFLQPFRDLGATFVGEYRRSADKKVPTSLAELGQTALADITALPRMAGSVLNLASAPVMAGVRPASRTINEGAARIGLAPHASTGNPFNPYRRLEGEEAQRFTEGKIMTALSAAKPATPRPVSAPKPQAKSIDILRNEKNAAYAAVDDAGVKFNKDAFATLTRGIADEMRAAQISPTRHPKATDMLRDINKMRGQSPTLTQLDQLRQVIQRDVASLPDGPEAFMGRKMIQNIDEFIDAAGPGQLDAGDASRAAQLIKDARAANSRYRKTDTVMKEVESANLRASSTYAGGNQANAVRQELRPLIDPTSGKRIKNLTPAETKALKKVVHGTGAANTWRTVGKTLDPRGLLGQILQTGLALPTHGVSAATIPLGMAASSMSNRATLKSVDDLLRLLSTGPAAPKVPPVSPSLYLAGRPGPPILSPAGLTGASVVAAPLARTRSRAPAKKSGSQGRK